METITKRVALVGMGTMGQAIEKQLSGGAYDVAGIRHGDDFSALETADIGIVAVKPQSFTAELATEIGAHVNERGLIVSIMAGVRLRRLQESLDTTRIVRTMPNLAVSTGESLTAWYADDGTLDESDVAMVEAMLGRWGQTIRLHDEALFDAFTALAGSSPALVCEMIATLEREAIRHGFTAKQARLIATQVLRGTASIVTTSASAAEIADRITSKGGTTRAARDVFERMGFRRIIWAAVWAATRRSRELGKS